MIQRHIGYDDDLALWATQQAQALRNGDRTDTENIAEEIEDLSRSRHRELKSRLKVLTTHLLKWQYQPEMRSNSWKAAMLEQKEQIDDLLEESPSLRRHVDEYFEARYERARTLAALEMSVAKDLLPMDPTSIKRLVDRAFGGEHLESLLGE